ncbi:MAG: hypothetical protein Q4C82_07275 [Eubacteriales bacterium]|nr:hypothetical protein [Eubacteriales bacterium]
MKSKLKKGTFGYLDQLKIREWKRTLLLLSVPILVFLIGWIVSGTRLTVVTVVAVVGCLPGCNQMVHALMASRYHSIDRELYEETERARGDRPVLYENVFTSYEKNFYVDCAVISGRELAGYSSDEKIDAAAAEKHLKEILRKNSYKQNVKIFTSRKAFLERARFLAAHEPEAVPFREDDRYPGMTREEIVRYLLTAISL